MKVFFKDGPLAGQFREIEDAPVYKVMVQPNILTDGNQLSEPEFVYYRPIAKSGIFTIMSCKEYNK